MSVKTKVIENIKERLVKDQQNLGYSCKRNSVEMQRLGKDNEVMKREIAKLGELIKGLDK